MDWDARKPVAQRRGEVTQAFYQAVRKYLQKHLKHCSVRRPVFVYIASNDIIRKDAAVVNDGMRNVKIWAARVAKRR